MSGADSGTEPASYELAGLGERASCRIVDTVIMAVIEFAVLVPATLFLGFLLFSSGEANAGLVTIALFGVAAASIPAVRYEVASVSRRGYTFAKGPTVRVIRWDAYNNPTDDNKHPDMWHSFIRWATPNGAALTAMIVAAIGVLLLHPTNSSVLVVYSSGPVVWTTVYLSSLFDENKRGWHDKAAGTVVVKAPKPATSLEPAADASDDADRWDARIAGRIGRATRKSPQRSETVPRRRDAYRRV